MAKRRKSSKASFPDRFCLDIIRWENGDTTKADPFFILVINNMAIERPLKSKHFVADMSTGSTADRTLFADIAQYIKNNLFGKMHGQAEKLLSDSPHCSKIKFWSIYAWGLAANGVTSLVGEDGEFITPRRDAVVQMLAYLGINPDIVFIVTNSRQNDRASAYATTDDDTRGGIAAMYDGRTITHRFYHKIPGMVAIHTDAEDTMTAAHEFGHAFSSFTNGYITDLYVDGSGKFNRKVGRPIPNNFAAYKGKTYRSDKVRNSLSLEYQRWQSYHSELVHPTRLALMDDYWKTKGGQMLSVHDKLTKAYIMDRISAKVSR